MEREQFKKGVSLVEIRRIIEDEEKKHITRFILENLPEWFGILEAREEYIANSSHKIFFGAFEQNHPIGFLYLKETSSATIELYVIGVLKEFHRQGIGRELFRAAKNEAVKLGYSFIQVKTVQMGKYEIYDRTNMFYLSLGFKELEVFPTLWEKRNPCQVYILSLR